VVRDLLIAAVPPEAIPDWRYAAALVTFFFYRYVKAFPGSVMMLLDAAGLVLFAVAGTEKALDYKIYPFMERFSGTITGVGGGTIRDFFLAHVPRVLQSDIYATAALVGTVLRPLPAAFVALFSESSPFISTGTCRASRIRTHPEHCENLESGS
jgi:uncharacterized membrane protein YeiH